MIRPRHEATKEHFRRHRRTVAEGVRRLAEGVVIEIAEEVADAVWGRLLDDAARSRVLDKLQPRVDDAVAWAESLAE